MSNSRKGNRIQNQTIYTIDLKHSEMLERFHNIETVIIPNLLEEKENLKNSVPNLKENQLEYLAQIKFHQNLKVQRFLLRKFVKKITFPHQSSIFLKI